MGSATNERALEAGTWRNWAGDQACSPHEILRPRSLEQLAEAIGVAAATGRTVSVAGSGHSFTEAALTGGTLIDAAALSGIVDADRSSGLVRVGGGTVLADLNEELHRLGLAMENLGDIDRQTVAGAISTGTHGTGARLRNISAQVEAMELVLGDGSVRELNGADDPRLLRAVRVGVGALGAISEVTLRCVPAFTLRRVDAPCPREEVLDAFQQRAEENDHFELFTFPYADSALVLGATAPTSRRGREAGRPPSSTTSCSRTGRWRRSQPPASSFRAGSRRSPASPRGLPPAAPRSTAATGSSPTSGASASPRWSTGFRASTDRRRRGG